MSQSSQQSALAGEHRSAAAILSFIGIRAEPSARSRLRTRPRLVALRLLFLTFIAVVLTSSPALTAYAGNCCCGATLSQGQQKINQGDYQGAIHIFECIITANPQTVDAYRGRIEAELMLGRYSDAFADYARVTAVVLPVNPDAGEEILDGYEARLASNPWSVTALKGASFAYWWLFEYDETISLLNRLLLINSNDVYANLFRGSNRLFLGSNVSGGEADLNRAIQLAPYSADVRFIVADAYTYALPDPDRALDEAWLALWWGLDTPRVHAILASAHTALGNTAYATYHLDRHLDLVTDETVGTTSLNVGGTKTLSLVPGRVFEIPIPAVSGHRIAIETSSTDPDVWDTILVLYAPDGSPVIGNDDFVDYYAGLDWVAPQTGTYKLRVTSFEAVSTGPLVVSRD